MFKNIVWTDLNDALRHSVMHGGACGHPLNRPKSETEASRWLYDLSPDRSRVTAVVVGSTSGRVLSETAHRIRKA